jgi:hypothetical protein
MKILRYTNVNPNVENAPLTLHELMAGIETDPSRN